MIARYVRSGINLKDIDSRALLWWATQNGHADLLEVLLENGGDPNVKGIGDDWTPVMLAAQNGHADMVKLLLKKGGDPNVKDIFGWTSLSWATHDRHTDMLEVLLENG